MEPSAQLEASKRSGPVTASTAMAPVPKTGLAFWMNEVLEQCAHAGANLAPDPVHDLRVALRRCLSVADSAAAVDPGPAWKDMKKAGRRLFRSLGGLRDTHVAQAWVHDLATDGDQPSVRLLQLLADREGDLRREAALALSEFDRKQWQRWSRSLPRRLGRLRSGSLIFRHLALERWTEAYALHRLALRHRSQVGFHRLRIGLKRFRYIAENFLPEQHAQWSGDLKRMQDLLGEVHDLDVLWALARREHVFADPEAQSSWKARIDAERNHRIGKYRQRTRGKESLWQTWRAALPAGKEIAASARLRIARWASLLDPDFPHSCHVAKLALQLFDGLHAGNGTAPSVAQDRAILQAAALLHDVGRSEGEQAHHKASYRLIRRLPPLLGWSGEELRIAAIVARYHRGVLPRAGQKPLRGLPAAQRRLVVRLAAILRLANAFDAARDGHIQCLQVRRQVGRLDVAADGYSSRDPLAEKIAAARHLLESVYRIPVIVAPLRTLKVRLAA